MKLSAALVIASILVSSSGAIVIPPADSPLWDSSPDVSHLRPLPKGLDLPHRGKVFAPARLRQQHEAEEAARQDKPCHDGSMRGYGMGPFRVSSSSLSDLLEKYSLGFLAPSTSSQSAESQAGAGSEFRILPAYQDGTEDFSALYRDMSWNKMESLKDWIEHVKERHAKIIGPHVFGDIQAYSIEQGDTRHAHLTAARVHSMNHRRPGCLWGRIYHALQSLNPAEMFFLAFTFGAGLGAFARILFMVILLLKRSHRHLNSAPDVCVRSSADTEAEPVLPPYSEVEDSKNVDEKVWVETAGVRVKPGGIPVAYL